VKTFVIAHRAIVRTFIPAGDYHEALAIFKKLDDTGTALGGGHGFDSEVSLDGTPWVDDEFETEAADSQPCQT